MYIGELSVGDSKIIPVSTSKNLGVWLDSHLKLDTHITKLCNAAYYHQHNIPRIQKYITHEFTWTLVHAVVIGWMTTATAFFIVPSNIQIHKLQRVQNMAARLVSNSSSYCHIMPVQELNWLRGYIQDHSWTGTYLYHKFGFSEEEISIPLEFRQVVVVSSTFFQRTCWETEPFLWRHPHYGIYDS